MTRVMNEYASKMALFKEKDKNLEGNDIREGLSLIISIRILKNFFNSKGKPKGALDISEARTSSDAIIRALAYLSRR